MICLFDCVHFEGKESVLLLVLVFYHHYDSSWTHSKVSFVGFLCFSWTFRTIPRLFPQGLRCLASSAEETCRPRRSILYMPGSNQRALEKSKTLDADCLIFDLEDACAPNKKVSYPISASVNEITINMMENDLSVCLG